MGKLNFIVGLFVLSLSLSCGKRPDTADFKIQLPWPTENGTYSLQFVPVGLTNLNNFEGPDVLFFDEPSLFETQNGLEIRAQGPKGKFSYVEGNGWVPMTFKTLTLATVYAHIERLNRQLKEIGFEGLLPIPRKIGIHPKITLPGEDDVINNAMYVAGFDGIFIFPFNSTRLPLALNAGVLAHEYFHAIFYHAYQKRLMKHLNNSMDPVVEINFHLSRQLQNAFFNPATPPRDDQPPQSLGPHTVFSRSTLLADEGHPQSQSFNSCGPLEEIPNSTLSKIVLRALNEGLADTWAWIYTNDTDYLIHSLGPTEGRRKVAGDFSNLPSLKELREKFIKSLRQSTCHLDKTFRHMAKVSYYFGTNLSRFIVTWAQAAQISRTELAKQIILTLTKMPVSPLEDKNFFVSFEDFISLWVQNFKDLKPQQCQLVQKILAQGKIPCTR